MILFETKKIFFFSGNKSIFYVQNIHQKVRTKCDEANCQN